MGPFLLVVLVALAAAGFYLSRKRDRERSDALAALGNRLGFALEENAEADEPVYEPFAIFRHGHSREPRNTLVGKVTVDGRPCSARCGDFRYRETHTTGKTTTTTTYEFSYVIVRVPWATPPLVIRPEGLFDKIAGAFGFDDIDFESVEFNKRFYVKSPDKKFAYDVVTPQMMEFLLSVEPPMLDLEPGAICCSDGRKRWDPDEYEGAIAFLKAFFDKWPRHLVAQLES